MRVFNDKAELWVTLSGPVFPHARAGLATSVHHVTVREACSRLHDCLSKSQAQWKKLYAKLRQPGSGYSFIFKEQICVFLTRIWIEISDKKIKKSLQYRSGSSRHNDRDRQHYRRMNCPFEPDYLRLRTLPVLPLKLAFKFVRPVCYKSASHGKDQTLAQVVAQFSQFQRCGQSYGRTVTER